MSSELKEGIKKITSAQHHNPFEILGLHTIKKNTNVYNVIRVYEPGAKEVYVINQQEPDRPHKMESKYDRYFFEFQTRSQVPFYQVKAVYEDGQVRIFYDPYLFPSLISDYDLHLFNEGNHHSIYEKLGAHLTTIMGVKGCYFSVWAPNAKKVSIVGNFNYWDGRRHQMRVLGSSGIWDLFIPGLEESEIYKFEITTQLGHLYEKSDPYGFQMELRPRTGSVVADLSSYSWNDGAWLTNRKQSNPLSSPVNIYEVHLGSWMRVAEEGNRFLTYREIAPKLAHYIKEMGYTHIELMPIADHPLDESWGYQVIGYFAPTSRYGTPQDFMYFVDYLHQENIGVIMDWVPGHFPKDGHGLSYFDGTHLYEHQDPRKREHKDWGTLIFNYGRNEVKNFLVANALFWLEKYHLDGLRVDAVASMLYLDYSREEGEWVPNHLGGRENIEAIHFLRKTNEVLFGCYPGIMMIAEESTSWPAVSKATYLGGLGFNFKWNMGWMNDTLAFMSKEPIHRKYHQNLLTFSMLYAFSENFVLSLSHDEVVHGKSAMLNKMPGDDWQKFANLRALMGLMCGFPGKKLNFMGTEFGQWNEWDCNSSLDWHLLQYDRHQRLRDFVKTLNHLYQNEPSLWEIDDSWEGFQWIDFSDYDNNVISFFRRATQPKDILIFVVNFTPVPRKRYRIGVPFDTQYDEILNSDMKCFGGSNVGNYGSILADHYACQNQPYSIELTLPPLGMLILKPK